MILLFFAPLVLDRYFLSLFFLQVWSVEELSKFELFRPNLEGENFCVQFLFVDFNYPFFWGMVVDNVFVFCARII
jgi:hypothetical protein